MSTGIAQTFDLIIQDKGLLHSVLLTTSFSYFLKDILQRGEILGPTDCTRRSVFFYRRLSRSAALSTTRRSALNRPLIDQGRDAGEGGGGEKGVGGGVSEY